MDEAGRGAALVFDEPIAVTVAVFIDPGEGTRDVRPDALEIRAVAGSVPVRSGQNDEEGRRIHAPVVPGEGHLAEPRHLAGARLVQDFARLGVLRLVELVGLRRRQVLEHAPRDSRVDPQGLERGDDPVAAERRAEPGNAGVGVRPYGVADTSIRRSAAERRTH